MLYRYSKRVLKPLQWLDQEQKKDETTPENTQR